MFSVGDGCLLIQFTAGGIIRLQNVFNIYQKGQRCCQCLWLTACQLSWVFQRFIFCFKKCMWTSVDRTRDNRVLNPSPVSRSAASSWYSSCGIRLSPHHFWYLQFPHLQVSLMASSWCLLSPLHLAPTAYMQRCFFFLKFLSLSLSKKIFEIGFIGQAAICASAVFTQLLPEQQLSRWRC